jgi:hypothetical protein
VALSLSAKHGVVRVLPGYDDVAPTECNSRAVQRRMTSHTPSLDQTVSESVTVRVSKENAGISPGTRSRQICDKINDNCDKIG